MRMLCAIALGLLVAASPNRTLASQALARPADTGTAQRPALFLGNDGLPPISFMKDGRPSGVVVDLARAIAQRMHRPVEIRLMNWASAQQRVQTGGADALLQINPTRERLEAYAFSAPLLLSDFDIFTTSRHFGITSPAGLEGLRVGLEADGLPAQFLQANPRIHQVLIPDIAQGFRSLAGGALDAIVVDRWVGSFVVAQGGFKDIRLSGPPITSSRSAIAVRKGDTALLKDIDDALAAIRGDGTYDRILEAWRPKEVVFETREDLRRQTWLVAAVSLALVLALAGIAVLAREVRRRRRAEEAWRESEGLFRSLADAIPQMCWMADGDGWIFWYNQRWYEYTGTRAEQMEGWGWRSVPDPAALPDVMRAWQASLATGRPFDMVIPLRGRDGTFRPFLTRVMPVTDEAGRVQRWFGTSTDISERIRAEEERQRVMERATQAQRLEALGVLVAGVAHNFNNILSVIMGTASIQEDLATEASQRDALKVIGRACERGRSLVKSLTQFARPTRAQSVSLEANLLAAEVVQLVRSTSRKNIEIVEDFAQAPLWITGDPGSLGSAFMNICINGLDAMPEGGTLTIRTRVPGPDWVEVVIEDSGEGMTPEVLAHATEPFFTTRPVGQGAGLGLSMAHGVVRAHDGTLELDSAPGQGTQVRIRLPRLAVPELPAPVPAPLRSGLPAKVLLVDDEEDLRFLMTRMLRQAGVAQVQAVAGGRAALDLLRSGAVPELVILDQNMPDLDGIQTLALMRRSHPDLPVLIASGQPDVQEWDAFRQAHVAIIAKPFNLQEIQEKMAGLGLPGSGD